MQRRTEDFQGRLANGEVAGGGLQVGPGAVVGHGGGVEEVVEVEGGVGGLVELAVAGKVKARNLKN